MTTWITCQLGAREHYSVPRALSQTDQLYTLITDAWVDPRSPFHYLPGTVVKNLCDRYHCDLSTASVRSFTQAGILFDVGKKLSNVTGWSRIISRNQWFQRRALRQLKFIEAQLLPSQCPVLFSYSYTALSLFQYAKSKGWQTILGQIDPGLSEEKRVEKLQASHGRQYASTWTAAPTHYWQYWKQECQLADRIVVNSPWSQTALTAIGVPKEKVKIVPLAYQSPAEAKDFIRQYPAKFTQARPLRVLFLGQVILRKGIAALLEALPLLQKESIEIWLVGSTAELDFPDWVRSHPKLHWIGPIPRSEVQHYYQQADVFLFPTHSDGFGLTQLEAQAWSLPIIASRYCGEVVQHQHNGLLLPDVSSQSIAYALITCCQSPKALRQWSQQSLDMGAYSLTQLANTLQSIAHDII
ncbi:MAG: glycosyltransferase family 4 protein [Cyanobacteria bacterium J06560_5]